MLDTFIHKTLRMPYTLHVYRYSTIPRPQATLIFLHGIGNSGKTWDKVAEKLPDNVNVIVLDLLGFGDSPKPDWAVYDGPTQARAIARTLVGKIRPGRVVLVGHSMGALVAVEMARRYPLIVQSLILCSPPIYNVDPSDDRKLFVERDEQLRRLYEFVLKNPQNLVRMSSLAKRYNLLPDHFDVNAFNVDAYSSALRANILNQKTSHDIVSIKKPIHILYGLLDPFVIGENIRRIKSQTQHVRVERFVGGHEIYGKYAERVIRVINQEIGKK